MPSTPSRKQVKSKATNTKVVSHASKPKPTKDYDTDSDGLPPLVDDDSSLDDSGREEESDVEQRRATCNDESVEMWLDLTKLARERHVRVMKIYLLSPFLFGMVEQEDKWINWAFDCGLLPSNSNFARSSLSEEYFEAVDIVEDAFDKLLKHMLAREDSDEILKAMSMMDKVNTCDKLEKTITCAESYNLFGKLRDKIKITSNKKKGDVSLLLAFQQAYDHIRKLTRENIDLTKQFEQNCLKGEKNTEAQRGQGNTHYQNGRLKAAITTYTGAINLGPFSYLLYGNRALSYLKNGNLREALVDGRRAVVLKPDWTKGQYRYAQAFFDLGDCEHAIKANRAAKKVCNAKESKDLDTQYDKFLSQQGKSRSVNGTSVKSHNIHNGTSAKKNTPAKSNLDDLPGLVDAETSDTSGDECDLIDDNSDDMPDIISGDSAGEGPPELVTNSSNDSDSDDYEDSHWSRKRQEEERKKTSKKKQTKVEKNVEPVQKTPKENKEPKKAESQGKAKKKKEKVKDKAKEPTATSKKRELMSVLKQGTYSLLEGKYQPSVRSYSEALTMLSLDSFETFEIKTIDYILILYAHGTACLETGIYKELLEATRQFETIITQYEDTIKFPLAFYGLGRVYHRQNRFSEALEPLNQGLKLVNTGEEFGVYRWPSSSVVIEETLPGKLKIAFEAIVAVCRNPPRADAVCRYSSCSGRTQIYLTDPDYKGFVRLICNESCKIEYHHSCWRKFKSNYQDKGGDKDFLDDECMTPDCGAPVEQIQIFSDAGLKTEFKSSHKADTKPTKHGKSKTASSHHKPTKQERHKKEKEEQKSVDHDSNQDIEEDRKLDEQVHIDITPKSKVSNPQVENEDKTTTKPKKYEAKPVGDENQQNVANQQTDTGVYILKKDEDKPEEQVTVKGVKSKGKKKTKSKNTQSLDEFLKDLGGSETASDVPSAPLYGAGQFRIPPPEWNQHELEAPFAIPPELQMQHQALHAEFHGGTNAAAFPLLNPTQSYALTPAQPSPLTYAPILPQPDNDATLDYILSMFREILSAHGPLDVTDVLLLEPVNYLPESYQKAIHDAGGLKQLFSLCGQFVVQGNIVMLPEDNEFQEIIKKVNPALVLDGIKRSRNYGIDPITSVPDQHFPGQKETESEENVSGHLKTSPLNPTSKEFYPRNVSSIDNELLGSLLRNATVEDGTLGDTSSLPKEDLNRATQPNVSSSESEVVNKFTERAIDRFSDIYNNVTISDNVETNKSYILPKEDVVESLTLSSPSDRSSEIKNNQSDSTNSPDSAKKSQKSSGSESQVLSPPHPTRLAINGTESVVGIKSKGVQTQPQVKAKGIMTDPIAEPFKSEYMKVLQEKEELARKFQEIQDKLNILQAKHAQEVDKMKKKFAEYQQEKEKLSKEVQSAKQGVKQELGKLRDDFEENKKLAQSLEERFKTEEDRYKTTIKGLQEELAAATTELASEKAKSNTENSQRDEAAKKITSQKQQQESRAQDAEIKLLELRRDVGLRFLERAFQEAHITVNNLIAACKTRNPTFQAAKFDELINSWRVYASDTHNKIVQCKSTFDGQIQELQNGRTLSALTQLPIPGPAQYPGPPVLQSLPTTGLLPPPPMQQPPFDNKPSSSQANMPPTGPAPASFAAAAPPTPASLQPSHGPQAVTAATANPPLPQPSTKATPQAAIPKATPQPHKQPPFATRPAAESPHPISAAAAVASGSATEIKTRPSNSFERIMLRLSTMYPHYSRTDLTGFIKEVRQNKHGTLTGLSLEEIVASVASLVEEKQKAGLIRGPPPVVPAGPPRTNAQPRFPVPTPKAAHPEAKPARSNSDPHKPGTAQRVRLDLDDDDPCVICHEEMVMDTVTLECGHRYHNPCIRKWLMGEQSTCPTCRVHALLPDEFPRLR